MALPKAITKMSTFDNIYISASRPWRGLALSWPGPNVAWPWRGLALAWPGPGVAVVWPGLGVAFPCSTFAGGALGTC